MVASCGRFLLRACGVLGIRFEAIRPRNRHQHLANLSAKLSIDQRLIEEARQAGRHATGEEAVRCALEEYVARRRRQRIVDLFGKVSYEDDYDCEAETIRPIDEGMRRECAGGKG